MGDYKVSGINIYPVKSLGGFSPIESSVMPRGLAFDRRWMLVDENGLFLTQRKHPRMALLRAEPSATGWRVVHKDNANWFQEIGLSLDNEREVSVTVWNDEVLAYEAAPEVNEWFGDMLGTTARLVWMPDDAARKVDPKFALNNEIVSFADGYPILLAGEASLQELNSRLEEPVGMDRFRPNIVISGSGPFEEDTWEKIRIGEVELTMPKTCSRCVLTTVDQETGKKGKEPLKTLSGFRNVNNRIIFGMNAYATVLGTIEVGQEIEVLQVRPSA